MAVSPKKTKPKKKQVSSDDIVDTALKRADEVGWSRLSLSELAAELGISAAELRAHFRDKDAIANAWFRRAQDTMLAKPPRGFSTRPVRDRLEYLMRRWFDALAPHQAVTTQMVSAKLWYAHPHHYAPMVFNLSRLIQWLRDAAGMTATGRQKQMEEIGLTVLFLAALRCWCGDRSPAQENTRAYLGKRLARAERMAVRLFGNRVDEAA